MKIKRDKQSEWKKRRNNNKSAQKYRHRYVCIDQTFRRLSLFVGCLIFVYVLFVLLLLIHSALCTYLTGLKRSLSVLKLFLFPFHIFFCIKLLVIHLFSKLLLKVQRKHQFFFFQIERRKKTPNHFLLCSFYSVLLWTI